MCTEPVRSLAPVLDEVEYQPLGDVRFKNIVEPVPVFEVVAGRRSREAVAIDPMCRMLGDEHVRAEPFEVIEFQLVRWWLGP